MFARQVLPASPALPLQVSEWINTPAALDLASLRGKVVMLHAFQMLCPGCIAHGLPQAERTHRIFAEDGVVVIGLHTVFEHHAVTGPDALRAFVHEYGWTFPIGIDRASEGSRIPQTMRAYALQGTPSLVLIDRAGQVRLQYMGKVEDIALGALIGRLLFDDSLTPGTAPA